MVLVLVTLVHLADSYAQLNSDTEAITATARAICPFQYAPFPAGGGLNTGAALRAWREIERGRRRHRERCGADALFAR